MRSLTTTVPQGGMTQLNRINVALGSASPGVSLEGTLRLEADQDIVAWTSQIDNLQKTPASSSARDLHSHETLDSFHNQCRWLQIQPGRRQPGRFSTTVELKFRDVDGNLKASSIEVIPGNGLLSTADILGKLGMAELWPTRNRVGERQADLGALTVSSLQRTAGTFEGVP